MSGATLIVVVSFLLVVGTMAAVHLALAYIDRREAWKKALAHVAEKPDHQVRKSRRGFECQHPGCGFHS